MAEAIRQGLNTVSPSITTEVADALRYADPTLAKFLQGAYLRLIRATPRVYSFMYDKARTGGGTRGKALRVAALNVCQVVTNLPVLIPNQTGSDAIPGGGTRAARCRHGIG